MRTKDNLSINCQGTKDTNDTSQLPRSVGLVLGTLGEIHLDLETHARFF